MKGENGACMSVQHCFGGSTGPELGTNKMMQGEEIKRVATVIQTNRAKVGEAVTHLACCGILNLPLSNGTLDMTLVYEVPRCQNAAARMQHKHNWRHTHCTHAGGSCIKTNPSNGVVTHYMSLNTHSPGSKEVRLRCLASRCSSLMGVWRKGGILQQAATTRAACHSAWSLKTCGVLGVVAQAVRSVGVWLRVCVLEARPRASLLRSRCCGRQRWYVNHPPVVKKLFFLPLAGCSAQCQMTSETQFNSFQITWRLDLIRCSLN